MNAKLIALILLGAVYYFVTYDDVTLFDQFLANGSLWAVLLMTYASSVCHDIIKISKDEALAADAPKLFSSLLASLFILINLPSIILPAVYIGYYDGWLAGIVAYFLLQIVSFSLSRLFNFKSITTTFYFWTAFMSCLVAYYLGYMDITNQSITEQLSPYKTMILDSLGPFKELVLDLVNIVKEILIDAYNSVKNWIMQLIN